MENVREHLAKAYLHCDSQGNREDANWYSDAFAFILMLRHHGKERALSMLKLFI